MRFEVVSAGEHGFAFDVHEGDTTLVRSRNFGSRDGVLKVYEKLKQPKQPELVFRQAKSHRKGKGETGVDFIFHLCLASDPEEDIAYSTPFGTLAESKAALARLRAADFTLEGDLMDKPTKKKSASAAKSAERSDATNKKQLVKNIADRSGIPPTDVAVVLTCLAQEIASTLTGEGKVSLPELGTFTSVDGKPSFKPSSTFTEASAPDEY